MALKELSAEQKLRRKLYNKKYASTRVRKKCPRDERSKAWVKKYHLLHTYGLTEHAYNTMLEGQNGTCPICLRGPGSSLKRLVVDHDHKTGNIMGLFCDGCNSLLGLLGDHFDSASEKCLRLLEYLGVRK